jgi:hypothetical protein
MEKLRISEAEVEKLIKAIKEWVELLRMNRFLGACKFPEFVPFVRRTLELTHTHPSLLLLSHF